MLFPKLKSISRKKLTLKQTVPARKFVLGIKIFLCFLSNAIAYLAAEAFLSEVVREENIEWLIFQTPERGKRRQRGGRGGGSEGGREGVDALSLSLWFLIGGARMNFFPCACNFFPVWHSSFRETARGACARVLQPAGAATAACTRGGKRRRSSNYLLLFVARRWNSVSVVVVVVDPVVVRFLLWLRISFTVDKSFFSPCLLTVCQSAISWVTKNCSKLKLSKFYQVHRPEFIIIFY